MPTEQIERKSYGFKADLSQNVISGGPAAIGNLDQGQDVIFPNAFKRVLPDFLVNGWVAKQHEWDDLPIAYPTVAREEGKMLYSEATFHSHQAAQDARIVASERLAAGKNVGLSIGFSVEEDHYFDSGEMLLLWAKEKKYDLSLFDTEGIMAWDSWCRGITQFKRLYEWSIVTSPMNMSAQADSCKRMWTVPGYKETPGGVLAPDMTTLVTAVTTAVKTVMMSANGTGEIVTETATDEKQDDELPASVREFETFLRDEGLSQSKARKAVFIAKSLQWDAASDDADPAPEPEEQAQEPDAEPDADTPAPDDTPEPASETPSGEEGKSDTGAASNVTHRMPDPHAPLGLQLLTEKSEVAGMLYQQCSTLFERIDRNSLLRR